MPDERPGRGSEQFVVRLPRGMRDRIAETARGEGRSMNAEVVRRLEESFRQDFFNKPEVGGIEEAKDKLLAGYEVIIYSQSMAYLEIFEVIEANKNIIPKKVYERWQHGKLLAEENVRLYGKDMERNIEKAGLFIAATKAGKEVTPLSSQDDESAIEATALPSKPKTRKRQVVEKA